MWSAFAALRAAAVLVQADVAMQTQRKGCLGCTGCRRFTVHYRACDANDPDVMFFCSVCGCSAEEHQVDQVRKQPNTSIIFK